MTFKDAYKQMKLGKFIRRANWKGYWFLDSNNRLIIRLANGQWIMQGDFTETVDNTTFDDWETTEGDNE